jgi:hypothetical protein
VIIDFNANNPHEIAELLCVRCLKRWIGCYPVGVLLKEIECPNCGENGAVVKTGQNLAESHAQACIVPEK